MLCVLAIGAVEPRLARAALERPESRPQWSVQAGRGVILATLGGWRTLVADLIWLKGNLAWEQQELATTRAWLDLVVAVDERPDYFWLNSARIIAYDMPVWRQRAQPGAPRAVHDQIRDEQAQQALAFLDRALEQRGPNAALLAERAGIHWRVCHDPERAAADFRRAAEVSGAPYYAGRIHAELLVILGRKREACEWLRHWLPLLPAADPEARRGVVAARLADLERELTPSP